MAGKWTATEIELLATNYPTEGPRAISERLNRSYAAVYSKASQLGIRYTAFDSRALLARIRPHRSWTPDEEDFLRRWYPYAGAKYLTKALGKTPSAVMQRADKLGVKANPGVANRNRREWTPYMLEIERLYYPTYGGAFVAMVLGITRCAATRHAIYNGICVTPETKRRLTRSAAARRRGKRRVWTDEQLMLLKQYYSDKGALFVSAATGRPLQSVYHTARQLGLKVSKDLKRERMNKNRVPMSDAIKMALRAANLGKRSEAQLLAAKRNGERRRGKPIPQFAHLRDDPDYHERTRVGRVSMHRQRRLAQMRKGLDRLESLLATKE